MLLRIKAPHFVAGVTIPMSNSDAYSDERVVSAAPIVKYMMGWNIEHVMEYCKLKNWSVSIHRT